MTGPPGKRNPRAGRDARASENVGSGGLDASEGGASLDISQLRRRPPGPGEIAACRAIWWR